MEHFYRLSVHFFAFVTFFVALQLRRGFSITEIDSYLANHAMRTVSLGDWLSCTLACHEDTSCISYNYNMETRSCDLNDYGVLTSVLGTDLLIKKRGVVFHQIRIHTTVYQNLVRKFGKNPGTNMKEEETKLSSYWSTPFTRLCLGMRDAAEQDTNWISLEHAATSLRDEQCTKQGFNTDYRLVTSSGKARIGIIGFPGRCDSGGASSRIGFGTEGDWQGMQDSNSCGNEKGRTTSKTAFGYIFVQ
ncbi:hypothetical protein P5673_018115 [Acropora cervicornis]|uniref:Apple domain-containing protein n=1 Tax=Acropora cervicornis TaxID=6130 RepID=A0AAD9V329_ACRCE|nr:hypothetical protein P5673_018115 [Acropora cervicornis]